jgi:DNA-binding transcriptional ArsR family regulator
MHLASSLDLTFHALSDGTRRSMIHALANGECRSAGELGRQFRFAQPTISRHLKVLEEAGIVERRVDGRVHQFRLRRKALKQAGRWIARSSGTLGRRGRSARPTFGGRVISVLCSLSSWQALGADRISAA